MTDNLRHWSALSKTDPKHTKPFQRAGGFRGTATRPIWTEYRLTEHFGPCGEGWGTEQPIFTLVPAGDEILVFCSLQCWYTENGTPKFLWGIGGDKVLVKQQSGLRTDDEAYKKAFTDALGNAFKHVGAGADVHMGLFEDSKYVAEVRREFEGSDTEAAGMPRAEPPPPRAGNGMASPAATGGHPDGPMIADGVRRVTSGQLPPVNPEEPPEVEESRQEMKRLLRAFREADNETAITAIWQANAPEVIKIKRVGGSAAFEALSRAAQDRLDEIRQGATA